MDKNSKVIDLLNGVDDLNNQTIKMIGDIETKLLDDPLRILRAIRFATVLDFSIDEKLYQGLKKNYQLVLSLSKTRIKEELNKILLSSNFMKGLNILKELGILDLLNISYGDITYVQDVLGMWSQINTNDMPFTNNEKKSIAVYCSCSCSGHDSFRYVSRFCGILEGGSFKKGKAGGFPS